MNLNSESGETVGPEVSWVGPRHEGWEAQQSCLGLMRWQQGATGNQEGPEATATPGEDDSAVLERRSGGHGLEMANGGPGRCLGEGSIQGSLVLLDSGVGWAGG